jgi:hypothetical protein
VLRQIGLLNITDFSLDLIAQLFNPDKLICEMAGWSLYQIDHESYESNVGRLGHELQKHLDNVIKGGEQATELMLFDKILFLSSMSIFQGITGLSLSYLADISEEELLNANEYLSLDERANNYFYIIYKGEIDYFNKGEHHGLFGEGQFLGEMLSLQGFAKSNTLLAREKTILLKINKDQLYELLADNVKLADRVLEYV